MSRRIAWLLFGTVVALAPVGIVLGVIFVKDSSDRDEGRGSFYGALWTLAAAALAWLGLGWVRLGRDAGLAGEESRAV